ncbi:hypothetical protein CDL12_10249 [Handroanthus impetiginosus]|uniref:Uncharacterized protein n=1 Tax=Handroanthus impetiginosus TaxID=429701 RepID=A0A2G9HHU1_9LAMI|nr:hypothetical protein CDL12_10249 [Handroanthus impetiginosus]
MEEQKDICHMTGERKKAVENSLSLESRKKKWYEVLYVVHAIDEYAKLVFTTNEGLKKKKKEEKKKSFERLCKVIKDILSDKVEKVVISDRIVDSPCCFVIGEYGGPAKMERIMKAQALWDNSMSSYMSSKKTVETNPDNGSCSPPLLLFKTAVLTSGFGLDDPNTFASRIHRMLKLGLSIDKEDPPEDADMPVLE